MDYRYVQTMCPCAFLQSQCKEKIYTIAGPEFGPKLQGKILIMNKSIYGLCLASASFHELCARVLHKIGFKPSHTDPDLWMKGLQDTLRIRRDLG